MVQGVGAPSIGNQNGRDVTVGGTASTDRVADVLYLFISGPAAMGVSEVARELGLSKAVVHRIFRSLSQRGFLQAGAGSRDYRLGPAAVALGARGLRDLDMRRAARPVLEELRDRTGETTTLSEFIGTQRVYLDQFESRHTIRMTVELGRLHPLYAGGTGKAIMAFLDKSARENVLSKGLVRLTETTITEPNALARELKEIATRGFAVSMGERQHDAGSVAAPIFDSEGRVIGALSVCGPVGRFDEESIARYGRLVVEASDRVSLKLGWPGTRGARGA